MYLINGNSINWICWIALNLSCLTFALKDVHVIVPTAVKRGDNANLTCRYDLENDTLYSIKWYKGKREFYRFTPKEITPMKVFSVAGITVERSMSNASNVMLTSMESSVSGKYSCEVSADAPTFHTVIVSGELEVVDLPHSGPIIDSKDKIYSIGDILQANCTVFNSKPSANLTWLINNFMVMPHQIVRYNVTKDDILNLEASVLGLKLVLTPKHFRSKNLKLGCKAKIYEIYENITEKLLDLDSNSNQILSDDFSTIGSSRHTQNDNEFGSGPDQYDIKMHHIQASPDMSTSSSMTTAPIYLSKIFSIFLITTTLSTSILSLIIRLSSVLMALILINWSKFYKNDIHFFQYNNIKKILFQVSLIKFENLIRITKYKLTLIVNIFNNKSFYQIFSYTNSKIKLVIKNYKLKRSLSKLLLSILLALSSVNRIIITPISSILLTKKTSTIITRRLKNHPS